MRKNFDSTAVFAPPRSGPVLLVSGLAYLALNLLFLVQHDLVNPATDAPRLPLLVFVVGSLALLAWLGRRLKASPTES